MKKAGILLPVFSVPSKYGIGDFGEGAYRFIDFLAGCGQSYWQVLPLGPTSVGIRLIKARQPMAEILTS